MKPLKTAAKKTARRPQMSPAARKKLSALMKVRWRHASGRRKLRSQRTRFGTGYFQTHVMAAEALAYALLPQSEKGKSIHLAR